MDKVKREEIKNDWKCKIIMHCILEMIQNARLKGYDIMVILTTVMCDVLYHTCEERSQELFEEAAETIKQSILDGVKEIVKQEKEDENGQK